MDLTIIMYHYVRDLERSRYPAIRGKSLRAFRDQLDYIAARFEVVTVAQILAALRGEERLPESACWLTFDDGYIDHYHNVFPLLDERRWQGSFFAAASPVLDGVMLDVNKIHFILASQPDARQLVDSMRAEVDKARREGFVLPRWEDYLSRYMTTCHLDAPEVLFIKLMLQKGLPDGLRQSICNSLFSRYVSSDEAAFAAELYLSVDQARAMVRAGMVFGSHGYSHRWMASLGEDEQACEIDRSMDFLERLGMSAGERMICYPYGDYNADTLEIARSRGCVLGVTTREAVADLARDPCLELPRVDTISIP